MTTAHEVRTLGAVRCEDHDYHEIFNSVDVQLEISAETRTSSENCVISREPVEESDFLKLLSPLDTWTFFLPDREGATAQALWPLGQVRPLCTED